MNIKINDISKSFNRIPVLQNLSLDIPEGNTVGIIGENGSGKTTLLKIISGLMWPEGGFGLYDELPIFNKDSKFKKHMIYWGHHTDLYTNMTAYENMTLFLNLRGDSRKNSVISSAINNAGLNDVFDKVLGEYSEGMMQRYHIARLRLSSWKLGVLDEPTNALDEDGIEILNQSIIDFQKKNKSLLIASHNLDFVKVHSNQIYKLESGKLEEYC